MPISLLNQPVEVCGDRTMIRVLCEIDFVETVSLSQRNQDGATAPLSTVRMLIPVCQSSQWMEIKISSRSGVAPIGPPEAAAGWHRRSLWAASVDEREPSPSMVLVPPHWRVKALAGGTRRSRASGICGPQRGLGIERKSRSTSLPYCCFPFVSIMNAVSRFNSSSRKSFSLKPRSIRAVGIEL